MLASHTTCFAARGASSDASMLGSAKSCDAVATASGASSMWGSPKSWREEAPIDASSDPDLASSPEPVASEA